MSQPEEKVLILAPVGQDAPAMAMLLGTQGISTVICPEPGTCLSQMGAGAGALLLTEEALELPRWGELLDALVAQPPWSELPLIVLTSGGESRRVNLLDLAASAAGSVTLLERPMTAVTLLRSVQVALRARRRQYRMRDLIAEHQRAEEALRRSEERHRLLAETMLQGVVHQDAAGTIISMNPAAECVLGKTRKDLLGSSSVREEHDTMRQDGSPFPGTEHPAMVALRTGQSVRGVVMGIFNPQRQERRWIRVDAVPVFRPEETRPTEVYTVFEDITEQKEFQAELERLVAERTAKLTDMVSELQHMSYAMVHDMRAPLRAMNGFAQSLAEGLSDNMAQPEALEYCRLIRSGASRLDLLITDALNYTKAALVEMPMTPVPLSQLVQGLLDTYPNFHPGKADIRVEGELPVVLGNESLLTQCFSNLLGNAVKFVAPGVKPRVRIWSELVHGPDAHEQTVEEGIPSGMEHGTRSKQYRPAPAPLIRIWVEDNGIGIARPAQKRLFGMFQKLDSQYEGTGVGLAIVRKVVERMGGKVGADSEPGKGSRFWVELPRVRT